MRTSLKRKIIIFFFDFSLLPNKNEERLVGNSRLVDPEMHGRKKDAQTKGLKTLDQRSKEAKKQRNEHNAPLASVFLLGRGVKF